MLYLRLSWHGWEGEVRCKTTGREAGGRRWLPGSECQALLSGLGHHRASVCPQAHLIWAQAGSELLTVGALKGEQGVLSRGSKKTGVSRVSQPFRKPKSVCVAVTHTPSFDSCLPGLCT